MLNAKKYQIMKTKAIQMTAILMMLTASVFAQVSSEKPEEGKVWTSMTLDGQDKVELRMIKPADARVTLSVYDETHRCVFKKRITDKDNLLLSHDISNFPNGVYTYEVNRGKELVMETRIRKSSGRPLEYMPENSMAEAKK